VLLHKIAIQELQCLGRDGRLRSSHAVGVQEWLIERFQQRDKPGPPTRQINSTTFPVFHKRQDDFTVWFHVDGSGRAEQLTIQPTSDAENRIAQYIKIEAPQRKPRQKHITKIFLQSRLISARTLPVNRRPHDKPVHRLYVPTRAYKLSSQP